MSQPIAVNPPCFICLEQSRNPHVHHVWMKARTGETGPLVHLCGSCHTELHSAAYARVAQIRGGNPNKNNLNWSHHRHGREFHNAEYLIKELVKVLLNTNTANLPKAMSLQLPVSVNRALMKFKVDHGLKNKSEALLACTVSTLSRLGYLKTSG